MTIPKQSNVNFVKNVKILQEYEKLPNGQWVLTKDDMSTELELLSFLRQLNVTRTTRMKDYAFDPIPKKLFRGMASKVTEADAEMRDEAFWNQYRQVELTKSEGSMDKFIHRIENIKGMKYVIFGLKALFENSIETSTPNYIDICPVNTILSHNYVDGLRSRLSVKTTANLFKHFFLSGYYGRGWGSHQNYYNVEFTYEVEEEFSARDDFKPGRYHVEESKAATLMLDIMTKAFESDFKKYVVSGKGVIIKVKGTADASPINRTLPYDGKYGEYDSEPVYKNDELNNITLNKKGGIADNEQLAFARALGVKNYIENKIQGFAGMKTEFKNYIEVSKEEGSQFRRISVIYTFVDAF
jgi:hypothetical protein